MSEPTEAGTPFVDRIVNRIRSNVVSGLFAIGIFLSVGAVFIVAAQGLFYLKSGEWPKWMLSDLIGPILPVPFIKWLVSPQDWHGLHKIVLSILVDVPIAVHALVLGIASICVANNVEE